MYGGPYLQTQQKVIETQQTLFYTQHSIIWTQKTVIETQHGIIEAQHIIIETEHSIMETQHNVIETQHSIIETQHNVIETQPGICKTQHNFTKTQQELENTTQYLPNAFPQTADAFPVLICYYTKRYKAWSHQPSAIITQPLTCYAPESFPPFFLFYLRMWRSVARMDVLFKCLNCSKELGETYQYCSRCGAAVDKEEVLIRSYFQRGFDYSGYITLFRKVPCNRNVYAYFAQ